MIVSRTPLRASFVGGGTDLPGFCNKERGAVVSTSLQKYVYVVIHPSFDKKNKIIYSKIENVSHVDEVENTRVREAMKMTGITKGIEIHSIGEVPSGTGLGGSSSFIVGLLNALYAYQGKHVNVKRLAKEAAEIEINILKEPIGRQDQYAAAFGGINKIEFIGEEVKIKPLIFNQETRKRLENNLMLFYLGGVRSAGEILNHQNKNLENQNIFDMHMKMRDLADEMEKNLIENNISTFGDLLHRNWLLKQQLAQGISNGFISRYYEVARNAGALGGKILGAGGNGFLLLYVEEDKQNAVRRVLEELREIGLKFDVEGSKIIYVSE